MRALRQRRLRPRPAASPRARSTTSTTPRTSSSGAARRASTRPASCPTEGYTPRLAGGDGRCRPEIVGQGRPAAGRSTASDEPSPPHRCRSPGRVKAFLRLVMIEHSVFALPFAYLAALTAMFQVDGGTSTGATLLLVTRRDGRRCAPSRWPPTGSSTGEIDARNPRTASRELVTGAVSVRTAWTGALVALVVFLGAAAAAQPALPGARAARRGPAGRLPVRQAVHRLPARDPRPRPGDRPGRRLARGHRHVRRLRAGLGARRSRSACGSAAST